MGWFEGVKVAITPKQIPRISAVVLLGLKMPLVVILIEKIGHRNRGTSICGDFHPFKPPHEFSLHPKCNIHQFGAFKI